MQKQLVAKQPQYLFTSSLTNAVQTKSFGLADVLIFKTNIQTNLDKLKLKKTLNNHPLILQWNVDQEDIDCVLRVVSTHLDHQDIVKLITFKGFFCQELSW